MDAVEEGGAWVVGWLAGETLVKRKNGGVAGLGLGWCLMDGLGEGRGKGGEASQGMGYALKHQSRRRRTTLCGDCVGKSGHREFMAKHVSR